MKKKKRILIELTEKQFEKLETVFGHSYDNSHNLFWFRRMKLGTREKIIKEIYRQFDAQKELWTN